LRLINIDDENQPGHGLDMTKQINDPSAPALAQNLWQLLGGPAAAAEQLSFQGPGIGLPSVYELGTFASASVGLSLLAIAELDALRNARPLRSVCLQHGQAGVLFRSERELRPIGWQLPPIWDPIAGDYATADGFVRLHTNYPHHREAVVRALGVEPTREAVAAAVASASAEAVETVVVAADGCAASLRSAAAWREHPQGRAIAAEPVFAITPRSQRPPRLSDPRPGRPLDGIRVLDLTRVIAGPICTRVLAGYGADVLRIDPPNFPEVGAVLAETTVGKRRGALDLKRAEDRLRFEALVAEAHVLVHGYRSDALERLGFGSQRLQELNPSLVIVCEDAYGFEGPWAKRRGFDSLVQMSCGICWRGREERGTCTSPPVPLPVQALDHGTGYLLAAAACRALSRLLAEGVASQTRLSLARTAKLLMDLGDGADAQCAAPTAEDIAPWLESAETDFGPVRRLGCPVGITGITPTWQRNAGPLGSDAPHW
jgi:hypothetical protein